MHDETAPEDRGDRASRPGDSPAADPPAPAIDPLGLPALAVRAGGAAIVHPDGEVETPGFAAVAARLTDTPHLVCNMPLVARRLGLRAVPAGFDVLELFAFMRPARFVLPTTQGLAESLTLPSPARDAAAEAHALYAIAATLLSDPAAQTWRYRRGAGGIAAAMARAGWPWGPAVLSALGPQAAGERDMAVWTRLPEWEEGAPPPPPADHPVSGDEAAARLAALLGELTEDRPAQRDYARAAAGAFAPRPQKDAPNVVLAEAGTGTGKTLGYLAPATAWAERNGGAVWLSTYTRNLQRQLDIETARAFPDPAERSRRAVVRKGRENYACLLNIEEAARNTLGAPDAVRRERDATMMGLVLRWLDHSRDGDMVGGDFPNWLGSYFGRGRLATLTDHRGECLYAACPHYRRCFIEHAVRRARKADIVIANHALVMTQAATRFGDPDLPRRYVFDEGHHLFDAADSAFSVHLTGHEGAELRRWLRGREGAGSRSRARGLLSRIEDLVTGDSDAWPLLHAVLDAARALPGPGWQARVAHANPQGPTERFLAEARALVLARAADTRSPYGLECGTEALPDSLLEQAGALRTGLAALADPLRALAARLVRLLDEDAGTLDSASRGRIEASARSLVLRATMVRAWAEMLGDLDAGGVGPADRVDWFALDRADGRERDIGLCRHALDPTRAFAETVLEPAHGAVITSATLLDRHTAEDDADWSRAETRTGAAHLVLPAQRFSAPSPFDYAAQSRVLIVTDVVRASADQVAAAYRTLFLAAGGGALGLFTAIRRLRAVHGRVAPALEDAGLPLYAQHVEPMDTGTLVDIFRAEDDACLLGTDAVRDGVDVPGRSLRLIVYDRVPWPRPTILHKARRQAFGGSAYDDMMTRLRLAQAFGRLIRRADDRGVFVLLDAQTPSRLLSALPQGAPVSRVGLAEAVSIVREFCEPV